MILYFDTSALVKLVVAEPGSELAIELWESEQAAAASVLVRPEGRAALAAARRAGRLKGKAHARATADFEEVLGELIMIGVDEELSRDAGESAEAHALRGYDAVHLATALALGEDEVAMVTWDADLARAAEVAGLGVAGALSSGGRRRRPGLVFSS